MDREGLMEANRINLLGASLEDLLGLTAELNEAPFRARQICAACAR